MGPICVATAGLSAAYGLAAAGVEVMVLERGDYSGAKNVTGGRLYLEPIRGLYPSSGTRRPSSGRWRVSWSP